MPDTRHGLQLLFSRVTGAVRTDPKELLNLFSGDGPSRDLNGLVETTVIVGIEADSLLFLYFLSDSNCLIIFDKLRRHL